MKWLAGIGLSFGFLAIGAAIYMLFEFTVIADFRETVLGASREDPLAYGEMLFETRGCAGCHAIDDPGAPAVVGPNLTEIASRHDAAYIRTSIVVPNAVLAGGCGGGACPPNVMPPYGNILEASQVDALVLFLLARTGPVPRSGGATR